MLNEEDVKPEHRVTIEYDPEYVDTFIELADALEESNPNIMVEGNPHGDHHVKPGSFEVHAGETLVHSRLKVRKHKVI